MKTTLLAVLLFRLSSASLSLRRATLSAPYNGASYLEGQKLLPLPSVISDEENPVITITRLLPNFVNTRDADACGGGDSADKGACLNTPGRDCMFISMVTTELTGLHKVKSHCLPCEIDGEEIPCWNPGAFLDGGYTVTECEMRCPHQKQIAEQGHACSDESGYVTQPQCFDKGSRSGSKCMFHSYVLPNGMNKSTCGPCTLPGVGGWSCSAVGSTGPEAGSKVTFCLSQCDVICMGPPDCPPTVAPPPPPPPPSPGVVNTASDWKKMLTAPVPYALPTVNPYAVANAPINLAKGLGWKIGTPPPPASYYPVVMYKRPEDYFTTTPAPPGNPGSTWGTPSMLLQNSNRKTAAKNDKSEAFTPRRKKQESLFNDVWSVYSTSGRQGSRHKEGTLRGRIRINEDTKIVESKGTSVYSLSDNGDIKEGFGASLYSHSRVGGHVDVVFPPRPTFVQAVSSSLKHWGAQEE